MFFLRNWFLKSYIWAAEHLYHKFAWAYDIVAWLVSFGNWSKWRRDVLSYLDEGKILEIGFGTGSLLVTMKREGCEVYGLEPSPQMIKVTLHRMKKEKINLPILQARAQEIPFPDNSLLNIISTFPSGYIFDDGTLNEIARVLAVGGRVLITGFGVCFNSVLKNWLTGWFLNGGSEIFITRFCQKAEEFGFHSMVIQHQGDSYILPIIILENEHVQ